MAQPITLLDIKKHAKLKIAKQVDYSHMADQHIIPLTLHEFGRAACEFPIVFVKSNDSDEFQSVAITGLKPGQNLVVQDKKWLGLYMPNVVRDYPLGLVLNPDIEDKVWIGIREASKAINKKEGDALFEGEQESEFLTSRKTALIEHYQQDQASKILIARLAEMELLVEKSLSVDIGGEKRDINGLFLIDEQKLHQLSDEAFNELREKGLLSPIFSHLTSLHQINRLAKREIDAS